MRKWITVLLMSTLLSFPAIMMAEGNHSTGTSSHGTSHEGSSDNHGQMMHEPSSEQHENITDAHTGDHSSDMSPVEHQNMQPGSSTNTHNEGEVESEGGGHSHGGGTVIETPPNYKVLSAFGAVNAGFLLIGLRKKWLKKKEVAS